MTQVQRDGLVRLYVTENDNSLEALKKVIGEGMTVDNIPDGIFFWEVIKKVRSNYPMDIIHALLKVEYNPIMMNLIRAFNNIPGDKRLHREKGVKEGNDVLSKIFGNKGMNKKK